jgi:hypothetical protein
MANICAKTPISYHARICHYFQAFPELFARGWTLVGTLNAVALRQRRGEAHVVLNSFLQLDAGKPRELADDAAAEHQHAEHEDRPLDHEHPLTDSGGEVILH